ncbi:hypothetical protein EJ05DRAFT_508414 [Pseudovirgaria hyperparasitica]|uniref:Uncharacterized protein n=1 Tax=Pseudovirgaria hyperparasitica TaxID=470096 RepID=A0A6A6WG93_9PEZI|nr:uncharacterized protein EJ05DRAFT_508414 [Pseudovirgaria hyperparasitica]KAF2761229.1 hypothetical protein EJ05DRAFT_508414 [Pseudovirgaria hyperparasitica]
MAKNTSTRAAVAKRQASVPVSSRKAGKAPATTKSSLAKPSEPDVMEGIEDSSSGLSDAPSSPEVVSSKRRRIGGAEAKKPVAKSTGKAVSRDDQVDDDTAEASTGSKRKRGAGASSADNVPSKATQAAKTSKSASTAQKDAVPSPPNPAPLVPVSRAEKIRNSRLLFDQAFDMEPLIAAARNSQDCLSADTKRESRPFKLGRYDGTVDQMTRLAFNLKSTDGDIKTLSHPPPMDWTNKQAITTLNKWYVQIYSRTTGGRLRQIDIFNDEEKLLIKHEVQKNRSLTMRDLTTSITKTLNDKFEGKKTATTPEGRPRRGITSVNAFLSKYRAEYQAAAPVASSSAAPSSSSSAARRITASLPPARVLPNFKKHASKHASPPSTSSATQTDPAALAADSIALPAHHAALAAKDALIAALQADNGRLQTDLDLARAKVAEKAARVRELRREVLVKETSLEGMRTFHRREMAALKGELPAPGNDFRDAALRDEEVEGLAEIVPEELVEEEEFVREEVVEE